MRFRLCSEAPEARRNKAGGGAKLCDRNPRNRVNRRKPLKGVTESHDPIVALATKIPVYWMSSRAGDFARWVRPRASQTLNAVIDGHLTGHYSGLNSMKCWNGEA